eukprot:GHVU01026213.1.p2 GENE.GHVU01026213.1~~GHVU01026213.1.p2  ORF type:complete len:153 (-),score=27.33 GHVU01026213.1:664-1122(-)
MHDEFMHGKDAGEGEGGKGKGGEEKEGGGGGEGIGRTQQHRIASHVAVDIRVRQWRYFIHLSQRSQCMHIFVSKNIYTQITPSGYYYPRATGERKELRLCDSNNALNRIATQESGIGQSRYPPLRNEVVPSNDSTSERPVIVSAAQEAATER